MIVPVKAVNYGLQDDSNKSIAPTETGSDYTTSSYAVEFGFPCAYMTCLFYFTSPVFKLHLISNQLTNMRLI